MGLEMTTLAKVSMSLAITWCQLAREMIKRKGVEGYEFVHVKHENFAFFKVKASWMMLWDVVSLPHGNKEKGGCSLDLGANHKCNESTQELKDEGGSTWCKMQRKKY